MSREVTPQKDDLLMHVVSVAKVIVQELNRDIGIPSGIRVKDLYDVVLNDIRPNFSTKFGPRCYSILRSGLALSPPHTYRKLVPTHKAPPP
ncbi:hypothetical protein PPTG_22237 [Phytophthora nicotianae INRA-310]|uniref:Uncharacterized protein n=1 Tax=Phytophthora nicotianae (strain INRA-310) TaxID=761204 RepID=W2QQ45_PHYN3|nr:hypothetical protein PPTG_22237 [Phytophthora nicotianae INRA-310]ETN14360.1 hypothetical protein PPTG_22237 [Phytophthora nicotianae INRA-310]